MKHDAEVRELARQLRVERHLPLNDIAQTLGISKSTAHNWLKDIEIPKTISSKQHENQRRGTAAMQANFALDTHIHF